mgnify:CR=1 FL=1
MSYQEEDYEVDATVIFRSDVGNLSHVKDVSEALSEYGYNPDDLIERREICKMYSTVKNDIENEIHRLAHSNQYEEAKTLRARLNSMRAEFDCLQTNEVSNIHSNQLNSFNKGKNELRINVINDNNNIKNATEKECNELKEDLALYHAIQIENLELEISKMTRPRCKYSKRFIELIKAETELIKLAQYDDARKVRKMLEKILPIEEKNFYIKYDSVIADKRSNLLKRQANE